MLKRWRTDPRRASIRFGIWVGIFGTGRVIVLPCGLTLGSHIRLVGRLRAEFQPKIALIRDGESAMVSQFKVELLGLRTVEGGATETFAFQSKVEGGLKWKGCDWTQHLLQDNYDSRLENCCHLRVWGKLWNKHMNEDSIL